MVGSVSIGTLFLRQAAYFWFPEEKISTFINHILFHYTVFFYHDTSSPLCPPVFPLLSSDLWSCYAGRASLLPMWKCHLNRAHGDTDLWRHRIHGPMLPR